MAESMGRDNKEAMIRRFTDSCGACYCDTMFKARYNLVELIYKCVNNINKIMPMSSLDLDFGKYNDNLPEVVIVHYD